jgi:hypothetical protein
VSCPVCRYPRFNSTESHPTMGGDARRIRRRCSNCGHITTVYEVKRELLDELKELRATRERIRGLVGAGTSSYCTECKHWGPDGCGLEIPEAGGTFASECSTFDPGP